MSDSRMPWVKFYTEALDDPKLGGLPDSLKWRFVSLVLMAGECDAEGALVAGGEPMTDTQIAWRLRKSPTAVSADLERLETAGLMDRADGAWRVSHFAQRQGRSQSERRADWRARKARQRGRDVPEDPPVTGETVTRDAPVTPASVTPLEKRREEKRKRRGESEDGAKPARPPDLLFDALCAVCEIDVDVDGNGASVGKVATALRKAKPPYTPDEVVRFGAMFAERHPVNRVPRVWQVKDQIGMVRSKNGHSAPPADELATDEQVHAEYLRLNPHRRPKDVTP